MGDKVTQFFKSFWDSIDLMKLLAILIVGAWLLTILFGFPKENETLKNIVLLIAGYLWGSSASSRKKDDAIIGQMNPSPVAPVITTETVTGDTKVTKTEPATVAVQPAVPIVPQPQA